MSSWSKQQSFAFITNESPRGGHKKRKVLIELPKWLIMLKSIALNMTKKNQLILVRIQKTTHSKETKSNEKEAN